MSYIIPYIKNVSYKLNRYGVVLLDLSDISFSCFCAENSNLVHIIPKTDDDRRRVSQVLPFMEWSVKYNWFICDIVDDIENGTNLYYTILLMLLNNKKKYSHNQQGLMYYVPDQDDEVDLITYYPKTSGLTISYKDGRIIGDTNGKESDFHKLVEEHSYEITGPHGQYMYEHVIIFDNY